MKIIEVTDELYLVDLPQNLEGFRDFISSWILKHESKGLVVDVGPSSTIKKLVEAIRYLKIDEVEYVLLTHIHIDHAGGVGEFLNYYPNAKVVVHEKGVKHLINPEKLWMSSKEVLGEIAEAYKKPIPVNEENVYTGDVEFCGKTVEIVKTPGHAPHHQSYIIGDYVFLGESAGVHMSLKEGYYLRPATPPRFIYDVYEESLKKLSKVDGIACFGHFGFEKNCREVISSAREQISLWIEVVKRLASEVENEREIIENAKRELLKRDKLFSRYKILDEDIKKREDYFIENSLKGILGYVKG